MAESHLKPPAGGSLLTAGAAALLGLFLLLWPQPSARLVCVLLGAALAASGAGDLYTALSRRDGALRRAAELALGAALAGVGLWLIARPLDAAALVARVAGALVCVHSCGGIGAALALRRSGAPRWEVSLAAGGAGLLLGLLLALDPGQVLSGVPRAAGLVLVYDGIACGWIALQGGRRPPEEG